MKRLLIPALLGLAVGQAQAATLCYFIVDAEGNVTSHQEPPYDLSYPRDAPLSAEEKAKRQKGRLVIGYTEGSCGTAEEILIQRDDTLSAALAAAGAKIGRAGEEPPPPPPPAPPKPPAPKPAEDKPTIVTAPVIREIMQLLDDGVKQKNLQAVEKYLSASLELSTTAGGESKTDTLTGQAYLAQVAGEWQENAQYTWYHTNVNISIDSSGKSATSRADLLVESKAKDGTDQKLEYQETITYTLVEGQTRISKIARVLKNPPLPALPENPPAEAPPPPAAGSAPGGEAPPPPAKKP